MPEIDAALDKLVVGGLHSFAGEWTGILALLLAHHAEARIDCGIKRVRGVAMQHSARSEASHERRAARG